MFVTKRDGRLEQVNLKKITNSVAMVCDGFNDIDFYSIAIKTINGLYDGVTTKELDLLSIQTAVGLIADDPIFSKVAARLLSNYIAKEVEDAEIYSFSQSIKDGYETELISQEVYDFVMSHKRKLNNAIKTERGDLFEYYGLRIVYDRYLLRHPQNRSIIENPQYWLLRVACGLSNDVKEVINFYNMISQHEYMPSTPTLFNSATTHPQMSSCFVAGTQVMTVNSGVKNIEDIDIGDTVITHNGIPQEVTQLHINPLNGRELYDIKCYGSPELTVTENHRFWSLSCEQIKWKHNKPVWNRADYIRTGDWIAIPSWQGDISTEVIDLAGYTDKYCTNGDGGNVKYIYDIGNNIINITSMWVRKDHLNNSPDGITMTKKNNSIKRFLTFDERFVDFLGIWYGDGSIIKRTTTQGIKIPAGIFITSHYKNIELIEFCKEVGREYLGIEPKVYKQSNKNWVTISFNSTFIGNIFVELFGQGFAGKKVYSGCYKWKRNLFDSLLAGLMSSDGCVSKVGQCSVTMANISFLKDVYMVGRQLGIPITFRKLAPRTDGNHRQASISIPKIKTIYSKIKKYYGDNRMMKLSPSLSTSIMEIDDTIFVKVVNKIKSEQLVDNVYTLGVENDHSYSIEGLICENCYLLDSPMDDLRDIEKRKMDIALLSKFAGGIGTTFSKVRGSGALIKGTNGISNGIIPFIHSLDANVAAVNQCFLPDTKIKTDTDTGWVDIKDIVVGDVIKNTNGNDVVTGVVSTEYEGTMITLETSDGEVHVTPLHSILCVVNGQDYDIEALEQQVKSGQIKPEWREAQTLNDNDIILSIGNDINV